MQQSGKANRCHLFFGWSCEGIYMKLGASEVSMFRFPNQVVSYLLGRMIMEISLCSLASFYLLPWKPKDWQHPPLPYQSDLIQAIPPLNNSHTTMFGNYFVPNCQLIRDQVSQVFRSGSLLFSILIGSFVSLPLLLFSLRYDRHPYVTARMMLSLFPNCRLPATSATAAQQREIKNQAREVRCNAIVPTPTLLVYQGISNPGASGGPLNGSMLGQATCGMA